MTSTEIKLTPAMVTALKGARIVTNEDGTNSVAGLPAETKTQTVKGLESRGLSEGLELTSEGAEAARQLGAVLPPYQAPDSDLSAAQIDQEIPEGISTPHLDHVVDNQRQSREDPPLADWERELLTDDAQLDQQAAEIAVLEGLLEPVGHHFHQTAEQIDAPAVDAGPSAEQAKLGEQLGKLLDKPIVVPNRADKRKAKFSIKAAYSRLLERKRQRRIKKYGSTKLGSV